MAVFDIDVSGANKLQQLYCGHNELESVNLSANKSLTRLGLNDNKLKTLDISNNQRLTGLYIQNNKISTKNINEIFRQLPERKKYEDKVNLRVNGNPGANKTKYLITVKKKWCPDIFY